MICTNSPRSVVDKPSELDDDNDDVPECGGKHEYEASIKTRIQQLQARAQQIPLLKMEAVENLAETKKEFTRYRAWMIQDLDGKDLQPDEKDTIFDDRLGPLYRWYRNEWECFEDECVERELELQQAWIRYQQYDDMSGVLIPRSETSLLEHLDLVENRINWDINDIGSRKNLFKECARRFRTDREKDRLRNLAREMQSKNPQSIQWYEEATAEWEEERRSLRYALAQAKICKLEAEKCHDSGDQQGRLELEKQLAELIDYTEELKEEVVLYREEEPELRSELCPSWDVDEGLVDME